MENAPEPGPAKKPRSTTPRTPAARKPATTRKPAAKPTAKPATGAAKPATTSTPKSAASVAKRATSSASKPPVKSTAKPAPKRTTTPRAKPAASAPTTPTAETVEVVESEVAESAVVESAVETPDVVESDVVETPDALEPEAGDPEVPETPEAVADELLESETVETPEAIAEEILEPSDETSDDVVADEVLEAETVLEEPESPYDPEAAEDVAEGSHDEAKPEPEPEPEPEPARVTRGRFTLPKLTLPKLVAPTLGRARTQQPETVEPVEVVEDVASDAPDLNEAVLDEPTAGETVLDEPTVEEAVEDIPLDEESVDEPVDETLQSEPETEVIEAVIVEESTAVAKKAPRKKRAKTETVLRVEGLTKHFDETLAVDAIDLDVQVGAFYGIVGPNGAGKTTTLSMITGLLRPDAGRVLVHGADVWSDPATAKRNMGVLPDRLRLFDRLTGGQLLHYAGVLRGLDNVTVKKRASDLAGAFGLEDAMSRLVSDYSAGMTKKIALAAAMIHSPRLLVLDEPFESVDPVSAATVTDILKSYAAAGGTVVLSSHSMDLVQRICDNVAVIVHGQLLADGTMDEVRDGQTLEERFVSLVSSTRVEGMEWLHSFSD